MSTSLQPLTLDGKSVAQMLGISSSHFHSLRRTGRFGPAPLKFGRAVRFSLVDVQNWIAAGCPGAARWEAMRGLKSAS